MRVIEGGLLAGVVVAGCLLRLAHVATPNLWWDELVQIRTADRPEMSDVFRAVRQGVPPGTGNAGAMPLDYVLLHAWLKAVPAPSPEGLEAYYRAPAVLWSCLALLALWGFCRSRFGVPVAAVATTLLAVSMPHVLYAAEVRFYSLFVLTVVLNLWALAWLLDGLDYGRRWLVWAAASVACVAAGLYGVMLLAAEFVVLGTVCSGRSRRGTLRLLLAGAALAALVAAYFAGTSLGLVYQREYPAGLFSARSILDTASFFGLDSPILTWAFLLGMPVALVDAAVRARHRLPLLLVFALAVLTIPAIVQIARWKHYYFHPRHAIFLLPCVHVATALALVALIGLLAPRRWLTALGLGAVLAVTGPIVMRYLRDPAPFFAATKTERDLRGFARDLAARVAREAPDSRHLVLVERNRPGHLANPLLDYYLRSRGLDGRIVLRGFSDPGQTLARVAAACARGCRGPQDAGLEWTLGVGSPFVQQAPPMRRLIDLREPVGTWPADIAAVTVVVYSPGFGGAPVPGFERRAYRGLLALEPTSASDPP